MKGEKLRQTGREERRGRADAGCLPSTCNLSPGAQTGTGVAEVVNEKPSSRISACTCAQTPTRVSGSQESLGPSETWRHEHSDVTV